MACLRRQNGGTRYRLTDFVSLIFHVLYTANQLKFLLTIEGLTPVKTKTS